jgi:hypothetical protein
VSKEPPLDQATKEVEEADRGEERFPETELIASKPQRHEEAPPQRWSPL